MSRANAHRRNGKPASCEPCRLGKIRCDHARPVCGRCQRRSRQSSCFYHPAPLTKGNEPDQAAARASRPTPLSLPGIGTSESSGPHNLTDVVQDQARGKAVEDLSLDCLRRNSLCGCISASPITSSTSYDERIRLVVEVLTELRQLEHMQTTIQEYYPTSSASSIPVPLILPALASLSTLTEQYHLHTSFSKGDAAAISLADSLLQSTAKAVLINRDLTAHDFLAMHTGQNLRLDYLGLIYAIAGKAQVYERDAQGAFAARMYHCSSICLRLTRELSPMSDALVWLSQERLILGTLVYGDMSEVAWHSFGDLSSDVYALGIHRESTITFDTPFFLQECRRKTFIKAYYITVFVAQLFNRPPRILRRLSDCELPLDLADDDLVVDAATVERSRSRLTVDGWDIQGKIHPASFNRVRCIAAEIREEILEYDFGKLTPSRVERLRDLSTRSRLAWESLPAHLRYDTIDPRARDLSPRTCRTLIILYLSFAQNDFQLFRILEKADGKATTPLLKVSLDLITTVTELGNLRPRQPHIETDFSYIMLCHGLSAAVVLVDAVHKLAHQGSEAVTLPPHTTRASLIRSLSVFVAQLDTACGPRETNYDVCMQASKAISRTLDEALNSHVASPQAALGPTFETPQADSGGGTMDFNSLDPGVWEDYDLSGWMKNIDWSGMGAEWSAF